jgi:hypothetical protein
MDNNNWTPEFAIDPQLMPIAPPEAIPQESQPVSSAACSEMIIYLPKQLAIHEPNPAVAPDSTSQASQGTGQDAPVTQNRQTRRLPRRGVAGTQPRVSYEDREQPEATAQSAASIYGYQSQVRPIRYIYLHVLMVHPPQGWSFNESIRLSRGGAHKLCTYIPICLPILKILTHVATNSNDSVGPWRNISKRRPSPTRRTSKHF